MSSLGPMAPLAGWTVCRSVFARLEETGFPATTLTVGTGNAALTFTALQNVGFGSYITIAYIDPNAASQALAVTVSGYAISISLATGSTKAITSTANDIKAAIAAYASTNALVSVALTNGSSGTGIVSAFAATQLIGWPVLLPMVKQHLRITHSAEDTILQAYIVAATKVIENYTSRRILPQTLRLWLDMVPGTGNDIPNWGAGVQSMPVRYANVGMLRMIELQGRPVQSFQSFTYYTLDNELQTYDAANYLVDMHDPDMEARVVLQYGAVWPVNLRVSQALALNYTVGYATPPSDICVAIMMIVAALYSNRGDAADKPLDILKLPAVAAILAPYRSLHVGTF